MTAPVPVLDDLKAKYLTAVADAGDEGALEEVRLAALGKKGEISLKMRELGKMTPEERSTFGAALNALKDEIDAALLAKRRRWAMRRWMRGCSRNGWM